MTVEFNWKYYAYGSYIGSLRVYWRESNGTMNLLRTVTGQQHTGATQNWLTFTENLQAYAGTTGRIVLRYGGHTYWRADVQLDDMELVGTSAGTINFDPNTVRGYSGSQPHWIRSNTNTYSTMPSLTGGTWAGVTTTTSTSTKWNYDSGGTPSSSTGGTRDAQGSSIGYYLYAEASSPNYYSDGSRYLWAAMAHDYTLQSATPTTIGTVTISGSATAQIGSSYGPYTYTAAIGGTAANPVYTWSIASGGTLVSSSGNQGTFNFTSAGTRTVQVVVTDSNATDSPVTQTYSVSVSVGTLYLGSPTVSGNASPVISTQETYTIKNVTDAATLTDETYQWSITGTGGTSGGSALQASGAISINDLATEFGGSAPHGMSEYYKGGSLVPNISVNSGVPTSGIISLDDFYGAASAAPLTFTGQGTTAITLTWPSTTGTYSISCVVASATASDSPKTATLAIASATSTHTITSPTLGSRITGGWVGVGDGAGEVNINRTSFVIGKVYDVTITTGSTSWHSSAGNFRLSTPHGMGISDYHNNIANGPNQSRNKRVVLRGDTNYFNSFVTATGVSDYYGIELHAWVTPGDSSTAGYIYRNFYDVSSYNTRSGNNPTVTAYSGSQTYTSTPHHLGTTIAVTINRASGGYTTNYVGQPLNFTAATSGWVLLNAIFRKGTGNWTATSDYFYFKVIEVQSNGNTDVEMIHSVYAYPSNTTSQYVASQWVHFDQGKNYRVYAYFSNRYNTASSTWGPHYIDIRSGNSSTGPLWHTYTCQVIVT